MLSQLFLCSAGMYREIFLPTNGAYMGPETFSLRMSQVGVVRMAECSPVSSLGYRNPTELYVGYV